MASERSSLTAKILALIPNRVTNKTVLKTMEVLRREQKLRSKTFRHFKSNESSVKEHVKDIIKHKGFIEDQNSYDDMKFGASTIKYSGCEIIAAYNAVKSIGREEPSFIEMIRSFEKDGMIFDGKFGTSPMAVRDYLNAKGYKTQFETAEDKFDKLAGGCVSTIITMYNDKDDISKEIHTVAVTKDDKGRFYGHNVFCNGKVAGPFDSVSEMISGTSAGKAKGICIIGVK